LKILVGPEEISGYYANLTKGFKAIGLECDYGVKRLHRFGYGKNLYRPRLLIWSERFYKIRIRAKNPYFLRVFAFFIDHLLNFIWAFAAIFRYDVFIFGFGKSLLPLNLDLFILKKLNKKVIGNLAHGSESRPPYLDGAYISVPEKLVDPNVLFKLTKKNKRLVEKFEKYTILIGSPHFTSHFARFKFLNSFALGIPINLDRITSVPKNNSINNNIVRILHAPSHAAGKGTDLIRAAINRLRAKGYKIDFILVENKPFNFVVEEILKCDFVVDQVFSDSPLPGLATEAGWFGKPTVIGGYGLNALKKFVPSDMWPPSKVSHPDEIEIAIEDLVLNRLERESLGLAIKLFIREKLSVESVAERYLKILTEEIPNNWWVDPNQIRYLEGSGQRLDVTKRNVKVLVDLFGNDSLELNHRPELLKAFIEFSEFNPKVN
jgi:hypothetical protein